MQNRPGQPHRHHVRIVLLAVLAGMLSGNLCGLPAAELQLQILDETSRQPLPARVRIRDKSGTDHAPPDVVKVPLGPRDVWFVSSGRSRLAVPAGTVELRVERGLEYLPIHKTFIIPPQGLSHTVTMRRWIDMRQRSYTCGENHVHVPVAELGPMLAADGLDFGSSLQWWNARRLDVPPGEGHMRVLKYGSASVPSSVFDYEIEHDWGAVYVVGQPRPLDIDNDQARPNLATLLTSHAEGALICYQGGWSREVLLDALLGCVDVVNVCNNNFLRHAYQPRSVYSNLLDIEGFSTYPDTPVGMMQMNLETYYRLLNCGLRLAAGAGSAIGAKHTPVGYNRAYVRAGSRPTLPQFLKAWRAGKNFVTNGPMLFLFVDRTYRPGDTVSLGANGGTFDVHVQAVSDQPLTTVEVVVNGQVIGRCDAIGTGKIELKVPVTIRAGSWIAARCAAEDELLSDEELAAYSWGSKRLPRRPTRLRFAHTSPVYVTVDEQPARVGPSISEAHQMLDALAAYARDTIAGPSLAAFLANVEEAHRRLSDTK